jgi:hypothetical protein
LLGKTGVQAAVSLLAAALPLSACGSAGGAQHEPAEHDRAPDTSALRKPRRSDTVPVGTELRVPAQGTTLVVTVTKVLDPLRGSGAAVPAGMKPIGVLIAARNAGPGSYDSSATSDFHVLSAAGTATAVYARAGICQTYIQDFMNEIGAGQARTGCIAYAIPAREQPTTVRFTPDGGTDRVTRSWSVS